MHHEDYLSKKSVFFENVHTHRILADLLVECVRRTPPVFLDVLRSEVDDNGIDVVITDGKVTRYIQLKARAKGRLPVKPYQISERLLNIPGGRIVWIRYEKAKLNPVDYFYLGGTPPRAISGLRDFPKAKNRKGKIRVGYRCIKMSMATRKRIGLGELADLLFPFRSAHVSRRRRHA